MEEEKWTDSDVTFAQSDGPSTWYSPNGRNVASGQLRHEARARPSFCRADAMAKGKDSRIAGSESLTPATGQSNRPLLHPAGSDSHVSDQVQYSQHQQQPRAKSQKHVVGGGTGGRMHARVPSSRTLHKYHGSTSSAKLARHQSSPSPERGAAGPASSHHRRATSDLKLSRDSSPTNLEKNASHSSLARIKSHVDIGRKNKSSTTLKRTASNLTVDKLKLAAGSKVHFNLGDEGDPDDEWVDASTSASPLLSRRASTIGGDVSANPAASPYIARPPSPGAGACPVPRLPRQSPSTISVPAPRKVQHWERETANYLTSRILQRTASYGAPPKMSRENVQVRPRYWRQQSPNDDTSSTLSGTPLMFHGRPGSSGGREFLTSRFVEYSDLESPSASGSMVYQTLFMDPCQTPSPANGASEFGPRRPHSAGNLADFMDFEGDDSLGRGIVGGTSLSRRIVGGVRVQGTASAPRSTNRTQQKINLERAGSGLNDSHTPHRAEPTILASAHGPPVGPGSGFDVPDPRISRMLERTGKEYMVVRRHQNPTARSLRRVCQLSGASAAYNMSRPGTGHSKKSSDNSVSFDRGQISPGRDQVLSSSSYPDLDGTMIAIDGKPSSSGLARALRERSEGGGAGTFAIGPDGSSGDDDLSRMHDRQRLSGVSLTGDAGEEHAATVALLRILWEKSLDLSASQD